ncbi:MAG TPA: hypothetical protein ENK02_08500 [Planctomycetes bacterium]|nr:hypothetical protein [Planctomycetota bacterium]
MRTETIGIGLYLLSAGLVALIGLEVKKVLTSDWVPIPSKTELRALRKELEKKGNAMQPDRASWRYGGKKIQDWWRLIETTNWVGKVPVVKTEKEPEVKEEPKPKLVLKPLSEILKLKLVFGLPKESAFVTVLYLDPNVQAPKSEYAAVSDPMGGGGADPGGSMAVFQDLRRGDHLYPPYEDIQLVDLTPDGRGAIFSRTGAEGDHKRIQEEIRLGEFEMSGDSFGEIDGKGSGSKVVPSTGKKRKWKNPGKLTKKMGENLWMVSEKDRKELSSGYDKFMKKMSVEDYVGYLPDPKAGGKRRKVTGVSIRKVPPEAKRFGVRRGDVLIAVNGTRVKGRASAIRLGKEQYKRGVRSFELTFLSQGREVVRTYQVPDEKK